MNLESKVKIINETRLGEFKSRVTELNALVKKFGNEVSDIVLKTRAEIIIKEWHDIAKEHGDNSIQGLLDTLWKWVEEIGFEYTYERQGNEVTMHVTKCPIADMAKSIGEELWGYKCYCCDDKSIVEGFNSTIQFDRSKTLMEGHDCCNHRYTEIMND